MNLIKSGHAYVNLQAWFSLLQATYLSGVATSTLLIHFLVQKHFFLAHKSRIFCNNTLMSAIIQETGGPLREERAVDGKLKSRLECMALYSRIFGYSFINWKQNTPE